jgi:hypothetical protein
MRAGAPCGPGRRRGAHGLRLEPLARGRELRRSGGPGRRTRRAGAESRVGVRRRLDRRSHVRTRTGRGASSPPRRGGRVAGRGTLRLRRRRGGRRPHGAHGDGPGRCRELSRGRARARRCRHDRRSLDRRRVRARRRRRRNRGRRRRGRSRLGRGIGSRAGGRSRRRRRQELERVDVAVRIGGDTDPEVDGDPVRLGRVGRADDPDRGTLGNGSAARHRHGAEMRQRHGQPVGGRDRDRRAAARQGAREADGAGGRREHGYPRRCADLDAAALPARVRVRRIEGERLQDRPLHGPGPRAGGGHPDQQEQHDKEQPTHDTTAFVVLLVNGPTTVAAVVGRCQT